MLFFEFFFFTAAPGTVKTWFPVRHPLPLSLPPSLTVFLLTHSSSPPCLPSPRLLYLCRGPAVTEHSVRRIRQLSLKNNKRSWKKRQEFLGSDVTPFTWRVLLLSVQPPTSVSCTSPALRIPPLGICTPHKTSLLTSNFFQRYLETNHRPEANFQETTQKSINVSGT